MSANNIPSYGDAGLLDINSSSTELNKIMKKKKDDRAAMMEGGSTQKEVFSKEVGMSDLTGESVILQNKIKSIADSYKEFSAMLRETAAARKIDVTEDEQEHLRTDVISTSMSAAHAYYKANSGGRLNRRK